MKNYTELVAILDRSGSMAGLEADTIGGYNALIERNKQVKGDAYVTTVLFDDKIETVHDRMDIREVKPLTDKQYWPRGCTALLDAVGQTITHIEQVQRYQPEGHKAEHIIFAIITDGQENASHEYGYKQVKQLIEKHQKEGWEFLFLGANIDVAAEAENLGIRSDRAVEYRPSPMGTRAAHDAIAYAACSMRTTGAMAEDWADVLK